jgi:hypothetical protein
MELLKPPPKIVSAPVLETPRASKDTLQKKSPHQYLTAPSGPFRIDSPRHPPPISHSIPTAGQLAADWNTIKAEIAEDKELTAGGSRRNKTNRRRRKITHRRNKRHRKSSRRRRHRKY